MKTRTYEAAFSKAAAIEKTRPPEKIQAAIETQQGIQTEAIRVSMELTKASRKKLQGPLPAKLETLADDPIQAPTIAKQRDKYNAAAARIDELTKELIIAQQARA